MCAALRSDGRQYKSESPTIICQAEKTYPRGICVGASERASEPGYRSTHLVPRIEEEHAQASEREAKGTNYIYRKRTEEMEEKHTREEERTEDWRRRMRREEKETRRRKSARTMLGGKTVKSPCTYRISRAWESDISIVDVEAGTC